MASTKQYSPKAVPQPTSSPARYAALPRELIQRDQWVVHKSVPNPKRRKPEKVPYNPCTGRKADTTDASTWGTFAEAVARHQTGNFDGIGVVLTALDPFAGVDLDHCRDAETGEITDWAQDVIQHLNSYTEVSPSGTGIHIFVTGKLPPVGRKKGSIEVYEDGRYLAVTGNHLPGTPQTIEERQAELTTWHASVWGLWGAKPSKSVDGGRVRGVNTLIPPPGVLAYNSPSISLKARFHGVSWRDSLAQAVLVRDREVQKAIVTHLERDGALVGEVFAHSNGLRQRFECPFHEESRKDRPSADLAYYPNTDTVKVRCHHRGEGGMQSRGIGLVDWYAWKETGEYHNLTEAELKLWTLRLFIDMGLIDAPAAVNRSLPADLPEDAPTELRKVYHGIVERARIWKLIGGYMPLTQSFLAHWCGVSQDQAGKCTRWLLKRFYLKGGDFLRKDGTVSRTRENKMDPECFVLNLEAKAWKPKSKTFIQRTRAEWAKYYAERREMENAEAIYRHDFEEAERRGDFVYWREEDEDFEDQRDALDLMDDEPLDPEIWDIIEAMEGEVKL